MRSIVAAGACVLLVGCGQPQTTAPTEETSASQTVDTGAAPDTCADGGTKLSGTGLCQDEARALIVLDPEVRSPELADCQWAAEETMLPGDEALLYLAATCQGAATKLAFAGGAERAEIAYEGSALFGEAAAGRAVIYLYGTDPDPQGALKAAIAALPEGERETCEIRPAGREGWPSDALVIAPNEAVRAGLPQDQPVVACGPLGVDETKVRYWRVRQGFAWFFDLGDRDPDFDAGNMTVIAKGADGAWQIKP